jgi:phytoene dehydrogenase-like protein
LDKFDTIVIGAGHNGLVCAAYLARAGQRVLVLEAASAPGGLAASHEFHPGYHASVAHSAGHFPRAIVDELALDSHGYSVASGTLPLVGLDETGNHAVLRDGELRGVSTQDQNAYREFSRRMARYARALAPFWLKTMPRIGHNSLSDLLTFAHLGINLRRMGKTDMRELLRVASLPARDLVDESFDNASLKAMLSWDGLIGSRLAPRSPNSAVLAMLYRLAEDGGHMHTVPAGGVDGLVRAVHAAATSAGAEVRYAAEVSSIRIHGNTNGLVAQGVELSTGEAVEANRVVSAVDPQRTFLDLVGVEHLDIGFTNRIRRLRCEGYVAKLHLALDGPPQFTGLEAPDGRMLIASDLEAIECAYDDVKYGERPENPVMEIVVPSWHDPSLAPEGKHVLSAHVMYVPYTLKDGWTQASREQTGSRAISAIARYAPGIEKQILASEFLTPQDLERRYRVTGGHWHHTEFAMDQMLMMRPTYEAAQYSTPIPGLFLCGAGCHPGGDITGAAGHNAAREILG